MGADLLLAYVLHPDSVELDWKAGHDAIDAIDETQAGVEQAYDGDLESFRFLLHGYLGELYLALEGDVHGIGRQVDFIPVCGGQLIVTGGMSSGDDPTEVWGLISDMPGRVLDAVGFRHSTGKPFGGYAELQPTSKGKI